MRSNGITSNANKSPEQNATPAPIFKNGGGNYAASDLAKNVEAIVQRPINEPEINKQALRAIAITSGRAGEPNARELAMRSFSGANNQHIEEIHGINELLNTQIVGATKHAREISGSMNASERYIRSQGQKISMTKPNKVKCGLLICGGVLLLAVGINTNATVLQASGIAAFENSISAYLFSGIPVAIALGLKAIPSHFDTERQARNYTLAVWFVGILFGVIWAYLFAQTFKGLTQTTAEVIQSLTETAGVNANPKSNCLLVFIATIAEACLSAGCFLTAQAIAEKAQFDALIDNPIHLKKQSDLDRWGKIHQEYVQLRSQLNGKLQAIESRSHAYIEEALSFYRAAVKAASDNQRLDDYLGS